MKLSDAAWLERAGVSAGSSEVPDRLKANDKKQRARIRDLTYSERRAVEYHEALTDLVQAVSKETDVSRAVEFARVALALPPRRKDGGK